MSYNELEQRGTADFPIEYYYIDETHTRYDMSAHWHSEMEIIRILDGRLTVKLNDRTYNAKQGDIVIVNSEMVHGAFPEDCKYECIVFHIDFFHIDNYSCRYFFESLLNHEYLIKEFNEKDNSEFCMAIDSLFETIRKKSSGYKFAVIGALYRLFGVIIDEHRYSAVNGQDNIFADKNVPKLKKVLTYVRENYDKQISLDDMSKAAGMSPKYFCYFFKEMTGKTPVEYLNGYRIEKASRKLLYTDLSVTEIAFASGFNDLSYFIKTFKNMKNTTPAKFRKG
jgi:AraC-like DNA-binding protein